MSIPDYLIEQTRDAADIGTWAARYIPSLKPGGASLVGLCPFHPDKKPSFSVSPSRGIAKCFSCGKTVDVFGLVMHFERIEFPQAVRLVARECGIDIPDREETPAEREARSAQATERAQLEWVNAFAGRWFAAQLTGADGASAREYLTRRGITPEQRDAWGIGYAPAGYGTLRSAIHDAAEARKPGAGRKAVLAAVRAGLLRDADEAGRPPFERFRDRVMLPIRTVRGVVCGFGGRALREPDANGKPAKYLNSAESAIFKKSELLYGLDSAADAIRSEGQAVIVEGYFDVIACHAAGITNAVAALGTAFGEAHVRLLAKYAKSVVLLFDADGAGQKAAARAMELCTHGGLACRVASTAMA